MIVIFVYEDINCYQTNTICNCSIEEVTAEDTTLFDLGYLTDRSTLPVLEVNVATDTFTGDLYALGPVECYGSFIETQGIIMLFCFKWSSVENRLQFYLYH